MKKTALLALAVFAWPALTLAQSAGTQPAKVLGVAEPSAAVPAVQYHSVFDPAVTGAAQDAEAWPAANARVGQYTRGHRDILKAEEAQAAPQSTAAPGVRR